MTKPSQRSALGMRLITYEMRVWVTVTWNQRGCNDTISGIAHMYWCTHITYNEGYHE